MKSIEHYWYNPNVLVWLLLPLSWLFCLVSFIRRKFYQCDLKKSFQAEAPVIVIGNIVAGGSGKTPLLIALCEYLEAKGYKPGVVSRGYGGSVAGVHQVLPNDDATLVGDEPLMINQRTNVPVVVGVDRVAAIDHLLVNNQCNVVLSDDGLQHYRMKRDYEIAVVDSVRKFGNGFCLPAGPLRERLSRLKDVNLVVYSGVEQPESQQCSYNLKTTEIVKLATKEVKAMSFFEGKLIHAVAGIGSPERFFSQLKAQELDIVEHAFPDHHSYIQTDFSGWDQACIIMTEKDAVKCRHLNLEDAWVLVVSAEMSRALENSLNSTLIPLLD